MRQRIFSLSFMSHTTAMTTRRWGCDEQKKRAMGEREKVLRYVCQLRIKEDEE